MEQLIEFFAGLWAMAKFAVLWGSITLAFIVIVGNLLIKKGEKK